MEIKVCHACKGCGMDVPTSNPCKVCHGTGYPPGYVPPTQGAVREWLMKQL